MDWREALSVSRIPNSIRYWLNIILSALKNLVISIYFLMSAQDNAGMSNTAPNTKQKRMCGPSGSSAESASVDPSHSAHANFLASFDQRRVQPHPEFPFLVEEVHTRGDTIESSLAPPRVTA
jgi:hypothetical protein